MSELAENLTQARAGAVVVTYFPEPDAIARLERLADLLPHLVVVDNTPGGADLLKPLASWTGIVLMPLLENAGIACALNVGIRRLIERNCDYFFLFDQDSDVPNDLIGGLLACHQKLGGMSKVAQVGPAYFDRRLQQMAPFIRRNGWHMRRLLPVGVKAIEADYLITSGACLTRAAWEAVGPMDESLFIDFVDIEWGLRAMNRGWKSYGDPQIIMQHTLGEEPVRVLGRKYPMHTPLRHYYFVRNCIALMRRAYVPLAWKVIEFRKLPLRFAVYCVFTEEPMLHFKMMCRGLWHGLIGKSGRM